MQKNNYFSAQEAKQQVENGDALSKNKKHQSEIIENLISVFYKEINKAMKKGELEVKIGLGHISDGIFSKKEYWNYNFNELSDKNVYELEDFFKKKGFSISFPGLKRSNYPYVYISWEYVNNNNSLSWYQSF